MLGRADAINPADSALIIASPDLLESCKAEHASQGGVQLLRDAAADCSELGKLGTASALFIMADQIEAAIAKAEGAAPRPTLKLHRFREEECGGAFDGTSVISDADSGL